MGAVKGRVGEGLVVELHQTVVVVICGWMRVYIQLCKTVVAARTDKKFVTSLVHLAAGSI